MEHLCVKLSSKPHGRLHIVSTDQPLYSYTVDDYLLLLVSLLGCSSVNMQAAQKLQWFDRTASKLHDLSACECGMIVCARCGITTISETAAPEGIPCAGVFRIDNQQRQFCGRKQIVNVWDQRGMSRAWVQLVWFECVAWDAASLAWIRIPVRPCRQYTCMLYTYLCFWASLHRFLSL